MSGSLDQRSCPIRVDPLNPPRAGELRLQRRFQGVSQEREESSPPAIRRAFGEVAEKR